jgi:hypothetical protein
LNLFSLSYLRFPAISQRIDQQNGAENLVIEAKASGISAAQELRNRYSARSSFVR